MALLETTTTIEVHNYGSYGKSYLVASALPTASLQRARGLALCHPRFESWKKADGFSFSERCLVVFSSGWKTRGSTSSVGVHLRLEQSDGSKVATVRFNQCSPLKFVSKDTRILNSVS